MHTNNAITPRPPSTDGSTPLIPRTLYKWAGALAILFAVLIVGAVVIAWRVAAGADAQNNANKSIHIEVAKAVLQVGVIAVFGFVASVCGPLIVTEVNRRRELSDKEREHARLEVEARRDSVRLVLDRLTATYVTAKAARRLIRSRTTGIERGKRVPPTATLPVAFYDEQIKAINAAQLELEALWQVINLFPFPEQRNVATSIRKMESYLNRLISEYEFNFPRDGSDRIAMSALPKLANFIGPSCEAGGLKGRFAKGYHDATDRLRKYILTGGSTAINQCQ